MFVGGKGFLVNRTKGKVLFGVKAISEGGYLWNKGKGEGLMAKLPSPSSPLALGGRGSPAAALGRWLRALGRPGSWGKRRGRLGV